MRNLTSLSLDESNKQNKIGSKNQVHAPYILGRSTAATTTLDEHGRTTWPSLMVIRKLSLARFGVEKYQCSWIDPSII